MEFTLRINQEYTIDAETEEQALEDLQERFAIENTTAENQFWDNMEVEFVING